MIETATSYRDGQTLLTTIDNTCERVLQTVRRYQLAPTKTPVKVEVFGGARIIAAFVLKFGKVVEDIEVFGFEFVVLLKSLEKLSSISGVLDLLCYVRIFQYLQEEEKKI